MLHSYSRTRTKRFLYLFNKTIPSNAASEPKTEREETSIWIDTQKNEGNKSNVIDHNTNGAESTIIDANRHIADKT